MSQKLLKIIQFATSHYKLQNNTRINVLYVTVEYWRLTAEQEIEDNGFFCFNLHSRELNRCTGDEQTSWPHSSVCSFPNDEWYHTVP